MTIHYSRSYLSLSSCSTLAAHKAVFSPGCNTNNSPVKVSINAFKSSGTNCPCIMAMYVMYTCISRIIWCPFCNSVSNFNINPTLGRSLRTNFASNAFLKISFALFIVFVSAILFLIASSREDKGDPDLLKNVLAAGDDVPGAWLSNVAPLLGGVIGDGSSWGVVPLLLGPGDADLASVPTILSNAGDAPLLGGSIWTPDAALLPDKGDAGRDADDSALLNFSRIVGDPDLGGAAAVTDPACGGP